MLTLAHIDLYAMYSAYPTQLGYRQLERGSSGGGAAASSTASLMQAAAPASE
jgi:hypothetical protein